MIDIENEIFAEVADYVDSKKPNVWLTSEYVKTPPAFPAASIVEVDNTTYRKTQTGSNSENHAMVMYEVNVYSNKKDGKKAECREVMAAIDTRFLQLGFTRVMMDTVQNLDDATIYRMVSRYRAVISADHIIYRS